MRKPDFLRAKEYKTMADHNAKLCADLVEECNRQGKIIDELTDENDRLKEMVDKQAYELKRLQSEYDALADDTMKHIRKLNAYRSDRSDPAEPCAYLRAGQRANR